MAAPRSPVPVRQPEGATTDWPYGPLADCGYGNSAYYHQVFDDFDQSLGATGLYTITAAGGSVALTAGDGGLALFTTGAVANNFAELQLPVADFTVPQGALAGKKLFYLARLQLSDVVNSQVIAGLCNVTATPFTAVADGVYFQKNNAAATLSIITVVGGTAVTTALPASSYNLVNATNIDLAFYIDWYGNVNVFTSPNMVGFVPQSGSGASLPTRGRVLQLATPALTTANLSPTLAISNGGAAAAKTMTVDFHLTAKER